MLRRITSPVKLAFQRPPRFEATELGSSDVKASTSALLVAVLLAGVGGYWLGLRTARSSPPTRAVAEGPVVARWSGGALGAAQLQARVVERKTSAGLTSLEPSRAREFADAVIQDALLAAEARRRGLEDDARVQGPLADLLARRLVELEVESTPRAPATDAALAAYYDAHRDDFDRPERIRLTLLEVKGPRAKGELEALQRELSALPAAAQNEALDKRGAERGTFTREALEARLGAPTAEAAWLLMNLERLELLQAPDSALLVRLEGREAGRAVTLAQARDQLESRLWYEQREAALGTRLEELRGALKLEVDEGALKRALSEVK